MTPLASVRIKRGLKRKELAAAVKADYTHLCNIENGKATASPKLAAKLALYFGGEITELQILYPERYAEAAQ